MEWLSRFVSLFRSRRLEEEYEDELRFHLEMKERENVAAGMAPEEARREAALQFGNATTVRERCRESNGFAWISSLGQDLRFGLRSLRKEPAFTVTALLALVLGIGANTAIFTVIRGVMLRPLPFPEPERIVMVYSGAVDNGAVKRLVSWSPKGAYELSRNSRSLEALAPFTGATMALTGVAEPRQVFAMQVTPAFFEVLRIKTRLGRLFTEREAAEGADMAVLSDSFWRSALHADPDVIGRNIVLDGRKRTIIGLIPPLEFQPSTFLLPKPADILVPAVLDPAEDRNAYLQVVARLKPAYTVQQAEAELNAVAAALDRSRPANRRTGMASVVPLQEAVAERVRPLLLILLGAVGLVLTIACANVANLLLALAGARRREIAVRLSLGASRIRLIRQLLTESILLSLGGGVLGTVLCYWAVPVLLTLAPQGQVPRAQDVRVDGAVLLFSLAVSIVTGIVFGAAPAIDATRTGIQEAMKFAGGRSQTGRGQRLRGTLVAAEVALTLVLLAGAGLLLKSFYELITIPTGFNREHILTVTVALPDRIYTSTESMRRFYSAVLARVRNLPGVESAGMVSALPLGERWIRGDFTIEGQPPPPGDYLVVKPDASADYFRTMGIPLLRGRYFAAHDTETAQPVAIITDSIARRFWGNRDPIGARLTLDEPQEGHWLTIVGVVGDIKQEKLASPIQPAVYVPFTQERRTFFLGMGSFVIRTAQDASSMAQAVRKQMQAVDPDLPIYEAATMRELVDRSVASSRFDARLVTAFAAVALLLAAIGVYGVVGYAVSQRTQEIGIRRALGAGQADVLRIVVGRSLAYVLTGLALGICGALVSTRTLASLLYEVKPGDPVILVLAPVVLGVVAVVAAYVPARRAMRVEPSVALRYE